MANDDTPKADSEKTRAELLKKVKTLDGPIMIKIKISKGGKPGKRIIHSPITIKKRFSRNL